MTQTNQEPEPRPDRNAPDPLRVRKLRRAVFSSLRAQGFDVRNGLIVPPAIDDKDAIRALHRTAVAHRVERARPALQRHETRLLERIAGAGQVDVDGFAPRLVEVRRGSDDERLFRWAALHWSIPVSSGYGRRLRFLVEDAANGKLVGLIGLGDPVFAMAARDEWIGWHRDARRRNLKHVVDAFVLGAVPPYSYLLCGKLVALLATSDEVRAAWQAKYAGTRSVLTGAQQDGRLALLTTTSALGRSSIYNRLRFEEQEAYLSVGETRGSGEFHFSDGLHRDISDFAIDHCVPTAKDPRWGIGFRNRREIVKKALPALGFSDRLMYHGVKRKVYLAPLGANAPAFLRGDDLRLWSHARSAADIAGYFKRRWMDGRVHRGEHRYLTFCPSSWQLWCP
jgi:hypothetical protein